jgi:hypothetical protein
MLRLLYRADLRAEAYAGLIAGFTFIGFQLVATAFLSGPATAPLPLRSISAMVLGPAALASSYSLLAVIITGLVIHLFLSSVFGVLFAVMAMRIAHATEGELLATTGQLALAGTTFGTVLWLVNFYVVAPLAGWTWFPGNTHHVTAFLGHAFFFGCPLGWVFGRIASSRLLETP